MKKKQLNQKGQSFAAMELLIASIMGLALLAVIVGLIAYFDGLSIQASLLEFKNTVISGINSPNGEIVEAENVILSPGDYSTTLFGSWGKMSSSCFDLQAAENSQSFSILTGNESQALHVTKRVTTSVFVKCVLGPELSPNFDCEKSCAILIGKPFENDS